SVGRAGVSPGKVPRDVAGNSWLALRRFPLPFELELKRSIVPTDVTELPVRTEPPRKRWTRMECDALAESGVLDFQRLELIEGELIDKMGKKPPHVNSSRLIEIWLEGVFGARLVIPDAPIDVSPEDNPTNEPEPDLIVLKRDLSN